MTKLSTEPKSQHSQHAEHNDTTMYFDDSVSELCDSISTDAPKENTTGHDSFETGSAYRGFRVSPDEKLITNEEIIVNINANINVKKNRDLLVRKNYGLVYREAARCTCSIPLVDKIQYGFEGLLRAAQGFDPSTGTLFSTYATISVRKTLYRFGNIDVRLVALPEYLSVHNIKIQNFIDTFTSEFLASPTPEQVSEGTGVPMYSVKRVLEYKKSNISLNSPLNYMDSDGVTLTEALTGDGDDFSLDVNCLSLEFDEGIRLAMNHLTDDERKLFAMVNGLDGYERTDQIEILKTKPLDAKGNVITTSPTLSRRYTSTIEKVRRIIEREGIEIRRK